jgi:2-desacetyl-2-hydroxyethyl bacteriochlorophyllide A dehydrogenase
MQTAAVVFVKPEQADVRRIEMPIPGPREVQIRTTVSTISAGTEGWAFRNLYTWSPIPFPCVPGYERVGTIVAMGPDVNGWRIGDRVMATVGKWDGQVKPFWGSHLALGNTSADELYRIPDGVEDLDASGAVVAQVGYNAASRPVINPGDWAVVYGDGLIGQCGAQAIRARGTKVILVGHRPERLALAAQYSADVTIDSRNDGFEETIRRHTGGKPVAVVLDTVHTEDAQRQYVPLLEPARGQIVYSGFTPGNVWADMALLQKRELTTYYIAGWTRERMEATLSLMAAGKMRLKPLITHLVPHTQGAEMYRMILAKSEPFLGITIDWTGAEA